ncbi:minor capsid protein [Geobacillus proteiniphilus]|uniref:Minor capsid protein n=1 Tax=Geobacillus proteiniphilus TaxID=860353 RepID=A0A1Q5SP84_9BACL|nr:MULTISPECIES: minor capsid protein [Geobacillus]OKO89746.1 Phage minor capsid protein [Geobacillus proteiniphilus]WMJ15981.1 minor capsid protein [Geobacillus proteiniphilus]
MEKYEILATLDMRTSDICRSMDGKVYEVKNYKPGTTAPTFHVRCRTTTIPYFDESEYTKG